MIGKITNKIVGFVDNLDNKMFYRYAGAFFAVILAATLFILYLYQSSVATSQKQMKKVNRLHIEIREILDKNEQVKKRRKEVDAILKQDPYFKIKNFFNETLKKLGLSSDTLTASESVNPSNKDYLDIVASAKLTDLSMQELAELLQAIEQNKRVHIRSLEISQKKPGTIDVNLTIATLSERAPTAE
ncbi:hypothetical protein HRU45_05020 [Candidatus Dependentiae bacterium]|nr:hypothetical protein [Candidatus Dependentiae bacterium]